MASYPVRRGALHLGMFSEDEVRNLLGLGRLLPGDEVQLPQGWVAAGVAFPAALQAPPRAQAAAPVPAAQANRDSQLILLRGLLGLALFFLVAAIVLDLALEGSLPEPLRAWRNREDGDSPPLVFLMVGIFFTFVPLLVWFVGLVAAWCRQKWGAHLMLGSALVLAVINMIEPTVTHGVASTCGDLEMLCEGGALALMYFTDVLAPTP